MIVLVYGLPGTGKSYFSRHLAKEINASYYLNTDTIWVNPKQKGNRSAKVKSTEGNNQLLDNAKEKLKKGAVIVLDGTFHKQVIRKKILQFARESGHRIFFIEVKASEQTVKQRLKNKNKYTKATLELYKKIKSEFEMYNKDHLELWSDIDTIDEMLIKARMFIYVVDD